MAQLYIQYVKNFISNFLKFIKFLGQTKKCVVNTHKDCVVSTHDELRIKKNLKNKCPFYGFHKRIFIKI